MGGGGFDEMEPIFVQVKPEKEEEQWSKPFLFHVHGLRNDHSALAIRLTDFHSNTFQALKSVHQLEDMRDMIGIGGSWSEFVAYVIASLKSEDVKLILEGKSKSGGAAYAKLIAQKAKGMPRISISLTKLVDAAASEAMANISLELFKAFTKTRNLLINEQQRCCQVTKILAAEQEKSETIQRQLFAKRQKISDKSTLDTTQESSGNNSKEASTPLGEKNKGKKRKSADKQATQTTVSTKASNRVVPAHRRAKVRGVLLQDTEDEQD